MSDQGQLVYAADPMCSWCWGFTPIVHALIQHFGDRLPVTVRLGGLGTGITEPMTEQFKTEARRHWEHVEETTGLPFNYSFFEREGFIYDTVLASRAVVAARSESPDRSLPFLAYLHAAFYRDNCDITDAEVLCDLAASFGFDRGAFAARLHSDAIRDATAGDFDFVRYLGLKGFPSLVGQRGGRSWVIFTGYRQRRTAIALVSAWLKRTEIEFAAAASAAP